MKTVQAYKQTGSPWHYLTEKAVLNDPMVLVFGDRSLLEDSAVIADVHREFPYAHIVFGSSAGEILSGNVLDHSITVTAVEFEKSRFVIKRANIFDTGKDSVALGKELIKQLPEEGLKHVFVVSEGSFVNGSSLIQGLEHSGTTASITGGLCGDNARFEKTLVAYRDTPREGEVVIIGFYGEGLEISFASYGGWSTFGPERTITRSVDNVLYEIDDVPALDLYSKYLGEKSHDLPYSALFYPLNVWEGGQEQPVVRTILNIDRELKSMIFAGDVAQDAKVQLMMASADAIADGAGIAAAQAMTDRNHPPQLALLVSCIGRKLVLDQRVEEEIEEVLDKVGKTVTTAGFYSYGEMAPFQSDNKCVLHNQTMTLTLISES